MENKKAFESFLFGDGSEGNYSVCDVDFMVDRLIILPSLRPFKLEKAVELCASYSSNPHFRKRLLDNSFLCPVLIYRLFKKGFLEFDEIFPILQSSKNFILCYYFRNQIKEFDTYILCKKKPFDIDDSFFKNENQIDLLIEYGFLPSSIGFCLKYDDIDVFRDITINNQSEIKWSPFEWSFKPFYQDLLTFSGFFGSINCFKHLLMNGCVIHDYIRSIVVCSGSADLFRICSENFSYLPESLIFSAIFSRLQLLNYFIENGADINTKNFEFFSFDLRSPFFTSRVNMVILSLLNILLHMEPI